MKNVVVPTDFSDCSLAALEEAARQARDGETRVHLLHVVALGTLGCPASRAVTEAARDGLCQEAESGLNRLTHMLDGIAHLTAVRVDRPTRGIVSYAKEVGADLIVMATHGREGLSHRILGSTAEEVVRSSSCPVLTVKPSAQAVPSSRAICVRGEMNGLLSAETSDERAVGGLTVKKYRVHDAMRAEPVRVQTDTCVHEVIDLMVHFALPYLPVVEADDRLAGVVLERDLSTPALDDLPADGTLPPAVVATQHARGQRTAAEVMRPLSTVHTVASGDLLVDAVRELRGAHISRLPVTCAGRLVGTLTRADVLRVLRALDERGQNTLSDDALAKLVAEALKRLPDLDIAKLEVHARNGVVCVHGETSMVKTLARATETARHVAGVVGVSNCLDYRPPPR